MVPVAPGLFSTRKLCPDVSVSLCATRRDRISVEPPGGNGTTIRTTFSGYSWAATVGTSGANKASNAPRQQFKVNLAITSFTITSILFVKVGTNHYLHRRLEQGDHAHRPSVGIAIAIIGQTSMYPRAAVWSMPGKYSLLPNADSSLPQQVDTDQQRGYGAHDESDAIAACNVEQTRVHER